MYEDLIYTYSKRYHLTKDCFASPMTFGATSVFQTGRLLCDADTRIPRHCQLNYVELTVVTGGEGTVITNDTAVRIKSGDIHVAFPGDFHEIISSRTSPLEYDYISLASEDPELAADIDRIIVEYHDEGNRIIHNNRIADLMGNILAEINEPEGYSQRLLCCALEELLILLIRAYKGAACAHSAKGVSDAQILCYSMMNYIDTHIYTMRSLSEMADAMRYNYNYLSNLYKSVTSSTLLSYYRTRRLETARLLLTKHSLSVTEVAAMLNYSSLYTFSRAYKSKYGCAPSKNKKSDQ